MSNVDQMIENMRIGRITFRNFVEELRAAGVDVSDYDYGIDPETGAFTNVKITFMDGLSLSKLEEVSAVFSRLNSEGVSFDVGSMLRKLPRDTNAFAFKLHDFGYRNATDRKKGKLAFGSIPATEHMTVMIQDGELTDAAKKL